MTSPRSADAVEIEAGRRIGLARAAQKMSQMDLGAALGVSFQQVQKYERGMNRIPLSRLIKAARALGKPLAYFLPSADDLPAAAAVSSAVFEEIAAEAAAAARDAAKVSEQLMTVQRGMAAIARAGRPRGD